MYSQLLAGMAVDRVSDMRREAKTRSLAMRNRRTRPGHHGHQAGRSAAAPCRDARLIPRAARS
jgi:hypothetical protein